MRSCGSSSRVRRGGDGRPSTGVEWLGRVDDATLHALYAGAACLAIPSLDEGFGLPAVEAMAVGCPVVAARAGDLPRSAATRPCWSIRSTPTP